MQKMASKLRLEKERALDYFIKKTFPIWQALGLHITPNHYHSPIPDTRALKDSLWSNHSELVGISINEKKQLELLLLFMSKFKIEYDKFPRNGTSSLDEYYLDNPFFGSVDGEMLYCMIRHFRPRRIFEIGSGYSTRLSAQAILKNREEDSSYECDLVAIDPYPSRIIKSGFSGLSKVLVERVQDVSLSEFQKLEANDILFIDSSHVLKIGSDVHYEYLEILPRLNKGVIVHFHDIFLPAEYDKDWVLKEHIFWNEQYLLQSFLAFNEHFEILWAGNYMRLRHPEKLKIAFSSNAGGEQWPASFWIKRIK